MENKVNKKIFVGVMIIFVFIIGYVSNLIAASPNKTFQWKMQTIWSSSMGFYKETQRFCKNVYTASGGRLKITPFPAGGIIGAFEAFDGVSQGVVEMANTTPVYWSGKEIGLNLLGVWPFGLTKEEYIMWLYYGGGIELAEKYYSKHNIKWNPAMIPGVELGGFSTSPIKCLNDLKGKKMRMGGSAAGAEILSELGVSIVRIPGGEVYSALNTGVLDAAEWSSPDETWPLKFHEVAKYIFMPGWHQLSTVTDFMININAWNSLPEDLKSILKTAMDESVFQGTYSSEYNNIDAIKKFIDYGVTIYTFPREDLLLLKSKSEQKKVQYAEKSPYFAEIDKSQKKFLSGYKKWLDFSKFE